MTYAALHPERVDRLVLFHTWADTSVFLESPRLSSLYALLEKDYPQFIETFMHTALGWSGTTGHQTAALAREWIPQEAWRALLRGSSTQNATSVLAKIECPTLILHRPQATLIDVAYARELAAGIPGSRLNLLDGESVAPFGRGTEDVLAAMRDFFADEGEAHTRPPFSTQGSPSTLRTILFTDIESHTAMMQRLGDQKGREVLREHERITREALAAHGGDEVKTMGDGFMASFGSTQKAIDCAIALQKAFAGKEGEALRVRVGINVGEPIAEDDDLFGSSVILAARTAAQAQGGEILVTDVVRQLVAGKGFTFADRGETEMRGFEDPVRLYEVQWS
jgi:class 3 adenylate cyclase